MRARGEQTSTGKENNGPVIDQTKIVDGRMHERMSIVGGVLGLLALAALAIYFLVRFALSTILVTVPKS
jgi:hypothetical protein